AQIGYAKCMTHRSQISQLSGRYRNPLFDIPKTITAAIHQLISLYRRIAGRYSVLPTPWPLEDHGKRYLLEEEDIADAQALVAVLAKEEQNSELVLYVAGKLSAAMQGWMKSWNNVSPIPEKWKQQLISELNGILRTEALHQKNLPQKPASSEKHSSETAASPDSNNRTAEDPTLVRNNRILFDSVFETSIKPYAQRVQETATREREEATQGFLNEREFLGIAVPFSAGTRSLLEELRYRVFDGYVTASLAAYYL